MRRPLRLGALAAVLLTLPACPVLLDEDFRVGEPTDADDSPGPSDGPSLAGSSGATASRISPTGGEPGETDPEGTGGAPHGGRAGAPMDVPLGSSGATLSSGATGGVSSTTSPSGGTYLTGEEGGRGAGQGGVAGPIGGASGAGSGTVPTTGAAGSGAAGGAPDGAGGLPGGAGSRAGGGGVAPGGGGDYAVRGGGGAAPGGGGDHAVRGGGGVAPGGGGGGLDAGNAGGLAGDGGAGGAVAPLCLTAPAHCSAILGALVHRYRFDGTGTAVLDSIGSADGTARGGAVLDGGGELTLAGGSSGEYVDLPNGIVSELSDATFEIWLEWHGGDAWQRVFDFGDSMATGCFPGGLPAAEDQVRECGRTFLNLTPATDTTNGSVVRVAFLTQPSDPRADSLLVDGPPITSRTLVHLAVVVNDTDNELAVFVDGVPSGAESFTAHLSDVNDINNWLGRSQFSSDASRGFDGSYHEFRIYGAALTEDQIAASYAEGPDPAFLE